VVPLSGTKSLHHCMTLGYEIPVENLWMHNLGAAAFVTFGKSQVFKTVLD